MFTSNNRLRKRGIARYRHIATQPAVCDIPLSKNLSMQNLTSGVVTRLHLEKVSPSRDKFLNTRASHSVVTKEVSCIHGL